MVNECGNGRPPSAPALGELRLPSLTAFMDGLQAGFTVIDRQYRVVWVNQYVQEWAKRPASDLCGGHCYRHFRHRDTECDDCPCAVTFRTGKPAQTAHSAVAGDGSTTHAEVASYPVFGDEGRVDYVIEFVRDISERVRLEADGHAAQELLVRRRKELEVLYGVALATGGSLNLEAILEKALDAVLARSGFEPRAGIFLLDEDGARLHLAAHRGFSAELVAARHLLPLGECLCGRAVHSGPLVCSLEPSPHVVVPLQSGGGLQGVLILYTSRDFADDPSELALFTTLGGQLGAAIDIARRFHRTDRQLQNRVIELEAERAKAKEVERQKDEFVAMLSHDLRTPLTSIQTQADLLRRRATREGDANCEQKASLILRGSRRMGVMISELVDLSRLESGQVSLHREPLSLWQLVRDVVTALPVDDGRRVEVLGREDCPAVLADRIHVERVVTNLVSNALKFSPLDAPVQVALRADAGEVVVSVTDRGPGIVAEHLPHLFERFYRAPTSTSAPGLGLGLYIAKLLVTLNGGRLWVDTERGRGSTFSFGLSTMPQSAGEG